ncbi:MAG TPA: hypothetical protein VFP33_06940 [Gallionella sp.]|nr:hypothetical protein [Gallionella sp.]
MTTYGLPAHEHMHVAVAGQRAAMIEVMRAGGIITRDNSWFTSTHAGRAIGIVPSRARYRLERLVAVGMLECRLINIRQAQYRLPGGAWAEIASLVMAECVEPVQEAPKPSKHPAAAPAQISTWLHAVPSA